MKGFSLLRMAGLASLLALAAGDARAVEVPDEGACPPYPLTPPGEALGDAVAEDVIPDAFNPGETVPLDEAHRLKNYLPPEVWERRQIFFYEGMVLQIGPCHRRFPVPTYFSDATEANRGKVTLDGDGNLIGYPGAGLPFAIDDIDDAAEDAGRRWAWNYRYRYLGGGLRGDFRIHHVARRGRKVERFEGKIFLQPLIGVPGLDADQDRDNFVAGGRFLRPTMVRGIAWRQFRRLSADQIWNESDSVFVWLPGERKVKRAPTGDVEGIFIPSYTRANTIDSEIMSLPDGQVTLPSPGLAASEALRKGFVGLLLRPNAYDFKLVGAQDVIAPINSTVDGYPTAPERSYGPSGLSVATDTWDIRRAVVIQGRRREPTGPVSVVTLYIDVLTQQPLYMISRRANRGIHEVGIFVGRYTADDPLAPQWEGNSTGFGAIVSVAETFFVAGDGGWLREAFEMRANPPEAGELRRFLSTRELLTRGR